MSIAQTCLADFENEMASTRRVLERIPDDKLDWRCHPKSNTIGWNANHLAEIPGWVPLTINQAELDVAPVGGEPYRSPGLQSTQAILELFDKNVAAAQAALHSASDEQMTGQWALLSGGNTIFTMPRSAVMRGFVISHVIHHRAHVCVYLRLNDIAVPSLYGPSGDEPSPGA